MTIPYTFDGIDYSQSCIPATQLGHNEWRWWPADTEENFKKNVEGTAITDYVESSFSYTVNSIELRCKEFDNIDFTKPTIVAMGCSFTFGIGLPQEAIWCEVLAKRLRDDGIDLQLINLSAAGDGTDRLVRLLSQTQHLIKDVDLIIGLLPGSERTELFLTHMKKPTTVYIHSGTSQDEKTRLENYLTNFVMDNNWLSYQTNKNLYIFELFAKVHNSSIILDSWSELFIKELPRFVNPRFRAFFPIPPELNFSRGDPSGTKFKQARDGMHSGPMQHKQYADSIYEQVKASLLLSCNAKKKL